MPALWKQCLTAVLALGLVGCAASRTGAADGNVEEGYALQSTDTAPRLLGCAAYARPVNTGAWVELEFAVDSGGRVVPASTVVSRARSASDAQVQVAMAAAASCSYEPAVRDGRAVEVRMRRAFLVPATP